MLLKIFQLKVKDSNLESQIWLITHSATRTLFSEKILGIELKNRQAIQFLPGINKQPQVVNHRHKPLEINRVVQSLGDCLEDLRFSTADCLSLYLSLAGKRLDKSADHIHDGAFMFP